MNQETDKEVSTFELDPFQKEAINFLESGKSVIVSAPTGSGKTAIAEFLVEDALKTEHERVFYTTPLKALSNQKFVDFQKKYGEDKVGLLTGDSAINRDNQIVVMTTEIYRNMLYGTTFGAVDSSLKNLRYLILDECHYMNDKDRGTVWEESIIYSPKNIRILALSATIQNAQELCDWISKVHGETKLIESSHRPVPLKFYYFNDKGMHSLLTTDNQMNPNLKEHKDSFRANKMKFKDRQRLQDRHVIRVQDIVDELNKKALLPAIYFVFSRRGCEEAMKECKGLGFSLLTKEEKERLSKLIQEKTYGNEYLFTHRHLGYLYQGMAVHHAGLLPQWKVMVEDLFSKGLIKVVFATETLAAGINMPAKTTIISNLSKRGDSGHQNLSSNQFLQMSGRAGRRGMDKIGNVVIKENAEHSAFFAAKLATSSADPLISQFSPNYAMALNLLQNHKMEEIKELLHKSFGQYLILKDLKNHEKDESHLVEKLKHLKQYPCPDPKNPGDIRIFRKQDEKLHEYRRTLNMLYDQGEEEHLETKKLESDFFQLRTNHKNYPCFKCENKSMCFTMEKDYRKLEGRLHTINKIVEEKENFYFGQFQRICNVLTSLKYLDNNIPTEKGITASSIRGENILLITEILTRSELEKRNLTPGEFAALVSSMAIDDLRPRTYVKARASDNVFKTFNQMSKIMRDVQLIQRDNYVEVRTNITPQLCGLVEEWCKKETTWQDLLAFTNLDEGDIIRALRRTVDLTRHIKNAPYVNPVLLELAKQALELMDKSPVKEVV